MKVMRALTQFAGRIKAGYASGTVYLSDVHKNIGPVCILICAVLLTSCAEDVLIDYVNVKPKLIVQSRLSPDTPFAISVTSSLAPDDNSDYLIPEGIEISLVDVTEEHGPVINLYQENGLFVSPLTYPIPGHSYKIFVLANGFPTAEATTGIPEAVELRTGRILDLDIVESEVTADKMNLTYDLALDFKPHQHRYFHFTFIQTTKINVGTVTEPIMEDHAYFMTPQFPNEDGYYVHHEAGILIDAVLTHSTESLRFSFVDYTLGEIEELGNLYIEIRTVTPEYYRYFTSLSRQIISRQDPFAEPIPVYNNIRDGGGNFSGFSSLTYPIPVK
jgi:hypothetical protein